MKKILSYIIILALIMTLASCGSNTAGTDEAGNAAGQAQDTGDAGEAEQAEAAAEGDDKTGNADGGAESVAADDGVAESETDETAEGAEAGAADGADDETIKPETVGTGADANTEVKPDDDEYLVIETPGEVSSEWTGLPKEAEFPDFELDPEEIEKKEYVIGFSHCALDHPYRLNMNILARNWCEGYGVAYIEMDGENDREKEVSNIENLIAQKVDAIIVSSHAGRYITPALKKAHDAGIKVVLIDGSRPLKKWEFDCWMSTDDYEVAKIACDLMVQDTQGEGKILEVRGATGLSSTEGRTKAINDTIEMHDYELVFSVNCKGLRENAKKAVAVQLESHPEITVIIAHNDEMALGAIEAIKDAGKTPGKDILVYSCADYQENAFEAIRDGELRCTQAYSLRGDLACEAAVALLEGKDVPRFINLGTDQATADNIDTKIFSY